MLTQRRRALSCCCHRGQLNEWEGKRRTLGGFFVPEKYDIPSRGLRTRGARVAKKFRRPPSEKSKKIGGGKDADSKNGTGKIRIFLAAFKSRPDTKLHRKGWKERKREKWWSVVGGLRSLAWIGGRQVPTSRCVAQYESSSLRFSFISSFFLVPACDHGVRAGSKPEFVSSPCQEAIQTNVSIR